MSLLLASLYERGRLERKRFLKSHFSSIWDNTILISVRIYFILVSLTSHYVNKENIIWKGLQASCFQKDSTFQVLSISSIHPHSYHFWIHLLKTINKATILAWFLTMCHSEISSCKSVNCTTMIKLTVISGKKCPSGWKIISSLSLSFPPNKNHDIIVDCANKTPPVTLM